MALVCDVCGKGPFKDDGEVSIYRVNQPGDFPRWCCEEHSGPMLDEDVTAIVRVIENGNDKRRKAVHDARDNDIRWDSETTDD